ncbi:MAG: hypothetical protein ACTHKB_08200 [Burkholderiaceae bacterium]
MDDLRLDPVTHDLAVANLDLSIIQGADRVRQNIVVKLRLFTGEWFLDTEFGTPYLTDILGKQVTLLGAIAAIKRAVLEVDDVADITAFSYNFSRPLRKLSVSFEVSTPFGLIGVSL